jgi:Sec-independent protein translocase protein TatA
MFSESGLVQFLVVALAFGLVLKPQDLPRAAHFIGRVCGRTVSLASELRQGVKQLAQFAGEETTSGVNTQASGTPPPSAFQLQRELQEGLAELRQLRILMRREWGTALALRQELPALATTGTPQPAFQPKTSVHVTEPLTAEYSGTELVLRALEEQAFVSEMERAVGPRVSPDNSE